MKRVVHDRVTLMHSFAQMLITAHHKAERRNE